MTDLSSESSDSSVAAPVDSAPDTRVDVLLGGPVDGPLDLDRIEADLADAETALARLDSGEYWRDEVTGAELDDAVLEADPVARRAPSP